MDLKEKAEQERLLARAQQERVFAGVSRRGLEEFERGLGCQVKGLTVRSALGLQCFGAGGFWGFGG